jgi:hypothetical protein
MKFSRHDLRAKLTINQRPDRLVGLRTNYGQNLLNV